MIRKTNCDECGVSNTETKFKEVKTSEQEYPGAKVWYYSETLCKACFEHSYPNGVNNFK